MVDKIPQGLLEQRGGHTLHGTAPYEDQVSEVLLRALMTL
jgi:hypothetical protein